VLAGTPGRAGGGASGPLHTDLYLVELAADGLEAPSVRTLVERPGLDDRPRFSPDGTRIAFVSTDGAVDYTASLRLCTVAAAGGAPRCREDGIELGILDGPRFLDWTPDGGGLLVSAAVGTTVGLFVAPAGGEAGDGAAAWRRLDDGERVLAGFSLARAAGRVAFLATDLATPFEVWTSDLQRFAPRRRAGANPEIAALGLSRAQTVRWTSGDGTELEGPLLRPIGAGSGVGAPSPLALFVHGSGPSGVAARAFETAVPLALSPGALPLQPLAAEGLRGLPAQLPGSGGYGEAFRRAVVGRVGSLDVDDVLSGVDARGVPGRGAGSSTGSRSTRQTSR
jgi:dipeptidyl aminopeptidase/acylaminoacyl peptidase